MARRTFSIGGVHPADSKISRDCKLEYLPIPPTVYIALSQHIGAPCEPLVKKGDTVCIYVGAPVSAILYRCKVTETGIPYVHRNEKLTIKALMKIRLQKRYPADMFTFDVLKSEYGIYAQPQRGASKDVTEPGK